jgi:hypothetical protein
MSENGARTVTYHGLRITKFSHQTGGGNAFVYVVGFGSVIRRVQKRKRGNRFDHSGNIYRSAFFDCHLGACKAAV